MQKTYTRKITNGKEKSEILTTLTQAGWEDIPNTSEYVERRFKTDGAGVVIYKSGKMVSQISNPDAKKVLQVLAFLVPQGELFDEQNEDGKILNMLADKTHIGCDEAGKGEYFGPLVAVACLVEEKDFMELREIGVKDSKLLSRKTIGLLAEKLMKNCKYSVKESMCNEGNLSKTLARLHSEAIEELLCEVKVDVVGVLVDKFSVKSSPSIRRTVPLHLVERGERDIAVAAASIIARQEYLNRLAAIEVKYHVQLPHGYGEHTKDFARKFIAQWGREEFGKIAKVSFKTTNEL